MQCVLDWVLLQKNQAIYKACNLQKVATLDAKAGDDFTFQMIYQHKRWHSI